MTNPPSVAAGPFAAFMRRPYLILVLTNLFWGGNVVAGKLAVGNIDPYLLMVIRWTGAVLLVLPFALGALRRNWPVSATGRCTSFTAPSASAPSTCSPTSPPTIPRASTSPSSR